MQSLSVSQAEFEQSIVEDLALLGVVADSSSYTSDYFDQLQQYCIEMIKRGKAYADDTEQETVSGNFLSYQHFFWSLADSGWIHFLTDARSTNERSTLCPS